MTLDSLWDAKKWLRELAERVDLDASAKTHRLLSIADSLGEAEKRLRALEVVVAELAVRSKLKESDVLNACLASSSHVERLLGRGLSAGLQE